MTLDAIHGFTGVPISGLANLADAVPCHLLKYTDSELRSIIRSNPFYYMEEIPAGTYNGQDENVATFGIKCLLCVSESMDDDLVYEITSILYENRDRLKDLHPALSYASQTGFMYEAAGAQQITFQYKRKTVESAPSGISSPDDALFV